jgi:carbon monoxide dehydrogenase subunit G
MSVYHANKLLEERDEAIAKLRAQVWDAVLKAEELAESIADCNNIDIRDTDIQARMNALVDQLAMIVGTRGGKI